MLKSTNYLRELAYSVTEINNHDKDHTTDIVFNLPVIYSKSEHDLLNFLPYDVALGPSSDDSFALVMFVPDTLHFAST